jgi:hypothetical protein
MTTRVQLVGLVPLLLLTCSLNAVTRGAYGFGGTFSARAGRTLPRVAAVIDRLFFWQDAGHCARQVTLEDAHGGSVWRAFAATWGRARTS